MKSFSHTMTKESERYRGRVEMVSDHRAAGRGSGGAGLGNRTGSTEVELIDPLSGGGWDRLVSAFPEASPFHCSAWARVLVKTYGHVPNYLRVVRDDLTVALVPMMEVDSWISGRRGVCVPFSDRAEPLVRDGQDPEHILASLADWARGRKWSHLELRGAGFAADFWDLENCEETYFGHRLTLNEDVDSLFSGCSPAARRGVRASERHGFTVRISQSWESMQAFIQLHEKTRKRHGAPPQPRAFFKNLHDAMIEPGLGFVVVAEEAGQPVAAAVFLRCGSSAVYKFGASDQSAWAARPNNLVMWTAIRNLAESGCQSLHFGRTSPGQSGLRRFKRSWGAVEEPLAYARLAVPNGRWTPSVCGSRHRTAAIFKRLPLTLNRLAGYLAYRHLD